MDYIKNILCYNSSFTAQIFSQLFIPDNTQEIYRFKKLSETYQSMNDYIKSIECLKAAFDLELESQLINDSLKTYNEVLLLYMIYNNNINEYFLRNWVYKGIESFDKLNMTSRFIKEYYITERYLIHKNKFNESNNLKIILNQCLYNYYRR